MRDEKQLDELHSALARMVWRAAPIVRLHYHRADDVLVAELVQADAMDEVLVLDRLLVEFDGVDADAAPTTLYLTGVSSAPNAPAVAVARDVLGEEVWATAEAMVDGGSPQVDVRLDADQFAARQIAWRGLAAALHERARTGGRRIGVEFVPGVVHAVLTDAASTILDEEVVLLDRNDPVTVVEAIARAAEELALRHPGTGAATCPIGVQLGGPVHTQTGMVEYYDKPMGEGDDSWKVIDLGGLLGRRTGRRAWVFNDASALADHEIEFGAGRDWPKVAVLVVRQGIGAKLVWHGRVQEEFPMEIGIFRSVPGAPLANTPTQSTESIEARSGVRAIIDAVARCATGGCSTIDEAADLAQRSDDALAAFSDAGRGLARGVAAIQSIVCPDRWVVFGPAALVDEASCAGRAFIGALRQAGEYIDYGGLRPVTIEARPTSGALGARAAAVAVGRVQQRRSAQ